MILLYYYKSKEKITGKKKKKEKLQKRNTLFNHQTSKNEPKVQLNFSSKVNREYEHEHERASHQSCLPIAIS